MLASYQSPGGKTRGAYCCSLIPHFPCGSSHSPRVGKGSTQHPSAVQGRQQEYVPVMPMFLARGYLSLRGFRKLGLGPAMALANLLVRYSKAWNKINLLDLPNPASLLASPVQDCALPQSHFGDFKSSKKLLFYLLLWELTPWAHTSSWWDVSPGCEPKLSFPFS